MAEELENVTVEEPAVTPVEVPEVEVPKEVVEEVIAPEPEVVTVEYYDHDYLRGTYDRCRVCGKGPHGAEGSIVE